MTGFQVFAKVFEVNINKRSRSAKGISEVPNTIKKKTLKEGMALKKQVRINTRKLAHNVWNTTTIGGSENYTNPEYLRATMEAWYIVNNRELHTIREYEEEQKKLGISNPYYRAWNVPYANVEPEGIEQSMEIFYGVLSKGVGDIIAKHADIDIVRLLAYADWYIEKDIHPWTDGCGRIATAVVMGISLFGSNRILPVFGNRKDHYDAMQSLNTLTRYYQACLDHGIPLADTS